MIEYLRLLWGYILADTMEVLPYVWPGLAAFAVSLIGVWILFHALIPGKERRGQAIAMSFLVGYSVVVLSIAFLSREAGSRTGVDWLPFSIMGISVRGDAWVCENVLFFIPYGFLLPLLSKRLRNILSVAGVGLLLSMVIEISQFLTKRGHIQTDDLITNVVGTVVGVLLFRGCRRIGAVCYAGVMGMGRKGRGHASGR